MPNKFTVFELKNKDLFTNDTFKAFVTEIPSTKRALKHWVAYGGIIPTHIGELRRTENGYIYYTTIGRTYLFERSKK